VRARLTASFVVLSVLLLVGALWLRGYDQQSVLRTHASREVRSEAGMLALLVEQREALDRPVDRAFLAGVVDSSDRLSFDSGQGEPVVVEGDAYTDDHADDAVAVTVDAGAGSLTLTRAGTVLRGLSNQDTSSLGFLVLLIALVAALVGYLMARFLTAPFRRLAGAAGQLGRGRFDLGLPRSRIPEVKALNQAMLTSAGQLQERLASEQAFAEHASHVLRTPLTGLRLELEELSLRDDLPHDARETAGRGLVSLDTMNAVAGELVELSRGGTLVAGADVPLVELATEVAQRWADRLAVRGRTLTAAVEGDLDRTYTPGPVEQVLDLLLTEVVDRGTGGARIVFLGQDGGHLRVRVTAEGTSREEPTGAMAEAREIAESLGGRILGDDPSRTVVALFPRR